MDEKRLARVRENLARRGLDQMLIVDPLSIWWLCGYHTEPYERFLALYVPAEGEPALFANRLFPDASGCGACHRVLRHRRSRAARGSGRRREQVARR